jgi:hypothetical protein
MRYIHENSPSKAALPKKYLTVFHWSYSLSKFQLVAADKIVCFGNFVIPYLEHILEESSNITVAWDVD